MCQWHTVWLSSEVPIKFCMLCHIIQIAVESLRNSVDLLKYHIPDQHCRS